MKKNVKILSLLLVSIMLTALLAGCGAIIRAISGKGESKAQDTPAEDATSATSADSDYEYIKNKGTMIIGITMYPPMNFMDKDNKLTGFDTEFAEAVCKKLGIKAEFVEINWDSKEVELNSKNIDCIWNGMCITEDRKVNMSISNPYMNNEQAIVMKASREKEILANVDGLTLIAEAGSTGEGKVDGSIADDGTEKVSAKEFFAKCTYVPADSMAKALMEVKSGTADMAIVDATLAYYNVGPGTDFEDLVANTDNNFGLQQFGIAFRKGSDMTEKINAAMKELVKDGTLATIASHYGLEDALIK